MTLNKKKIFFLTVAGVLGGFAANASITTSNVQALVTDPQPTVVEQSNSQLATQIAQNGMVLLKNNNNALPISPQQKIALFGAGAYGTYYGGSGSGSVSSRDPVNIWRGLKTAGYQITSENWLNKIKPTTIKRSLNWVITSCWVLLNIVIPL